MKSSLAGVSLGATVDEVREWTNRSYPASCSFAELLYQPDVTGETPVGALVLENVYKDKRSACHSELSRMNKLDHWEIQFVHQSANNGGRVYQLSLQRFYSDLAGVAWNTTLDEVKKALLAEFGPPSFMGSTQLQEESLTRAKVDIKNKVHLDPLRGTTLWWGTGKWNKRLGDCLADCGNRTLRVEIKSLYGTAKAAKDEHVFSLSAIMRDDLLWRDHFQWLDNTKMEGKSTGLKF